jgi:long-chain acyl-CoA synthetase
LIIRGGFNISPREVEEVLMLHPKIQEAAVIAAKDKRGEEFVKAIVVLQEGESLSVREVVDFCAASMAPYKQPKVVEFIEALPKSVTGKILRNELRGEVTDKRLVEREDT